MRKPATLDDVLGHLVAEAETMKAQAKTAEPGWVRATFRLESIRNAIAEISRVTAEVEKGDDNA